MSLENKNGLRPYEKLYICIELVLLYTFPRILRIAILMRFIPESRQRSFYIFCIHRALVHSPFRVYSSKPRKFRG